MKKFRFIAMALASLALSLSGNADSSLATSKFKVAGITCGGCEKMIGSKLQALDGVKNVEFTNAKEAGSKTTAHFLSVSYARDKVTSDQIVKAVASAGEHYKATQIAN